MTTYRSRVAAEIEPNGEPTGFVVLVEPGDRIHFLDWWADLGEDRRPPKRPATVLIHGLGGSGLAWSGVARRLRDACQPIAMDLRGHGLSDAPTEPGAYDLAVLAADVVAVAEGSGAFDEATATVVLAGLGFGAIVAAAAAADLGDRCSRLVLVDGGLADIAAATGQDVEAFLRAMDEPPEVMRSMTAYLADRRSWDPGTWDGDEERAARAAVVETPAGRLVFGTRPHALEACVRTMFEYRPDEVLARVTAPIIAIRRITPGDDDETGVGPSVPPDVQIVEVTAPGHNLLRYRPAEVAAAILGG
jgi:pimeloyl-ACP methyl ester carboxylesterase